MSPLAWIGAAVAALYLYSKHTGQAPANLLPQVFPPAPGTTPPATVPPIIGGNGSIPPNGGQNAPTISDAVIQEWFANSFALDGSVPYAQRVALINTTAAQYDVTRSRIASALGYKLADVNMYLDGKLDYFHAG